MGDLWATTCYFNPAGYSRRLPQYRAFRQRLGAPLITVELSFDGRFALEPGDADILVQLSEGDVMMQKERLLNLALRSLPADCDAVAWLDCDVVWKDADWPRQATKALDRYAVVHLLSGAVQLGPDAALDNPGEPHAPAEDISVAARLHRGELTPDDFRPRQPIWNHTAWGYGWAARREILDAHGLYDACVINSGDMATYLAAAGAHRAEYFRDRMNGPMREHYYEWAEGFHRAVQGRVGYLPGEILHLWHGTKANRRYQYSITDLRDRGFDPAADIAPTASGAWRWATDKPELHEHVRNYFWGRREDGGDEDAE